MNKQRGGTLLGLILGALIGLGAALAVAVYITKVPVPFMNKSQPRDPDGDAAEAKKNRDWDPNAPLAGRHAARPQAAASAPVDPPVAGPAAPASAARPLPAASAAVASKLPVATPPAMATKPPVSDDPLGDLARAKSTVKAAAKPEALLSDTAVEPFNYFIQAGAFRTPEDAEQQRARLTLMGFQAKISEREQSGRTVYRVRLGPFDKKDDAEKTKDKLDNNSIETALVRVQR